MKVAVISEISAISRNPDILGALEGYDHEIINVGMSPSRDTPELQYNHSGFLAALLLNSKTVDFVIGGCGTGQGFMISVSQYPNVFCGHILTPLDAWLFAQINGGNVIALPFNQGYGWAGDINLRFVFEKLFSTPFGSGYPKERQEPQRKSRQLLYDISQKTHQDFHTILQLLDRDFIAHCLLFPGIRALLNVPSIEDSHLRDHLTKFYDES